MKKTKDFWISTAAVIAMMLAAWGALVVIGKIVTAVGLW